MVTRSTQSSQSSQTTKPNHNLDLNRLTKKGEPRIDNRGTSDSQAFDPVTGEQRYGHGGIPDPNSPRRCKGRSRVRKARCMTWALQGSDYCRFHGGRMSLAYKFKKGIYPVQGFYSKYLGPKLTELVRANLNEPHDEQVCLYQELAITRSMACEAIKLAQPLFDDDQRKLLNTETKAMIFGTLQSAMGAVKELVLAAARIEKDSKDKVSLKVINLIVAQIIESINQECGTENQALAEAIAKKINDKVRVPINDKINPVIEIDMG